MLASGIELASPLRGGEMISTKSFVSACLHGYGGWFEGMSPEAIWV